MSPSFNSSNAKERSISRRRSAALYVFFALATTAFQFLSDISRNLNLLKQEAPSSVQNKNNNYNNNRTASVVASSGNGVTLFYNLYIPNETDVLRWQVMDIVREQLDQISESYAASSSMDSSSPLIINYVTLGNPPNLALLDTLCWNRNLTCHHLKHYDQGNEEITLQHLYNHCLASASADDDSHQRVIYIHSKGSYHNTHHNQNWRKHLLAAATSKECLTRPLNDTCNVCGLQFYPIWTTLFPGNFFTAKCSYIRQLIPPSQFEQRLDQVSRAMRQQQGGGGFQSTIFQPAPWTWGEGRQAAEHWVGSHPNLVPCDVSQTPRVYDWVRDPPLPNKTATTLAFEYRLGPRFPIRSPYHMLRPNVLRKLLRSSNQTARDKEYYLLGGSLVKWKSLYNATPDASSWIWKWYPDGEKWRERVVGGRKTKKNQTMTSVLPK